MKRLLLILNVLILLLIVPDYLHAYDFEVDGICYSFNSYNESNLFVTSGDIQYQGDVVIPDQVLYNGKIYQVTSISSFAFSGCSNLTSITIPNSVVVINNYAFNGCSSLNSVIIPNSVMSIRERAFQGCSSLTSVTISKSVTSINSTAFSGCSSLSKISVDIGNTKYDSRENCNAIIETSSNTIVVGCKNTIFPNSVTTIGNNAFEGCSSLTSMSIPPNITSIGNESFSGCSGLTSVTIPNSVTSIGFSAFSGCSSLTSVTIPNNLGTIGDGVFWHSGLTSVTIPNNVTFIGSFAFCACSNLTSITIPNSVTTIGKGAFENCGLTSITIPSSITTIEEDAFNSNSLSSVFSEIMVPFAIKEWVFSPFTLSQGQLTVPEGTIASYKSTEGWNKFHIIKEDKQYVDYLLSIIATGNGSASYSDTTVKNSTKSFTLNEGTSATITITPENGYQIKSVKVNSTDVTSKVSNNQYTISNISANTTVEVEFEAIPIPTYALIINATGNGSATYNDKTAKNSTQSFNLNEGTSATIIFSPDNGYRIKSVKVNSTDVTSSVSNNKYTVDNIKANTTIEVEFEAIPIYSYTLKYVVDGETYKTYEVQEGATITPEAEPTKEGCTFSGWSEIPTTMPAKDVTVTGSFTVNKYKLTYQVDGKEYKTYNIEYGATITPEAEPTKDGYSFSGWSEIPTTMPARDVTVTGTFTQNKPDVKTYTIKYVVDGESYKSYQIQEGATIIPEAEPTKEGYTFSGWSEIPTTMPGKDVTITGTFTKNEIFIKNYTLTITATGNGNASYNGTETRNSTQTFTLNEGITATVSFNPDNGYQIKSAKMNGREIADLSTMSFTIDIMDEDVTIEVEFEAIPINTYTIKYVVDGETYKSYQIEEGETITPEAEPTKEGYTFSGWSEIPSIMPAYDVTIIGTFTKNEPEPTPIEMSFVIDGINYEVVSMDDHTVIVVSGNYGQILDVPATITYGGIIWSIIGLKDGALDNCNELAAVIWNPSIAFNARVSNPNLLLYVKDEAYKSLGVKNVVVNGTAGSIELTDAANGNDFYCPRAFTAKKISYSHYYNMETGLGDSKGWETIVLPFDVQKYNSRKGEIEPFTKWTTAGSTKPFWLFELTASGYKDVEGIKANIPYIISMPNNPQYLADYVITGIITFSAENVEVKASDDMQPARYLDRTFVPNYINQNDENCFALNVNNYYVTNSSTDKDGCKFIKGLRSIHPFEAYMTTTSNTRSIDVLDGMATAIKEIMIATESTDIIKVYDTKGVLVKTCKGNDNLKRGLAAGVYIVNGKKMIIK